MRVSRPDAAVLHRACLTLSCVLVVACAQPEGGPAAPAEAAGVAPIVARAEAAIASGDLDSGIDSYRDAFERTPWNTRIASSLVAAYVARAEQKRVKPGGSRGLALADADLRAALAISPGDSELGRSLAVVLLERAAMARDDAEVERLREEARGLAPELTAQTPVVRLSVERRLDVAYDLLERGQLDAGLDQLEALLREYPQSSEASRLLAQALVRKGSLQTQRADYAGARQSYARAVELYAQLSPCDGTRCDPAELELAHRNRISSALDSGSFDAARAALAEAEGLGLAFPDLERRWPELRSP